jgi:hypothetical protein
MRSAYLQNLGIGEIWELRNPETFDVDGTDASVANAVASHATNPVANHTVGPAIATTDVLLISVSSLNGDVTDTGPSQDLAIALFGNIEKEFCNNYQCKVLTVSMSGIDDAMASSSKGSIHISILKEEVERARPKFIWIFGAEIANALLEMKEVFTVEQYKRMPLSYQEIPLLVTYDTEFLISHGEKKIEVWRDACRIKEILS